VISISWLGYRQQRTFWRAAAGVALVLLLAFILAPFLWLLITSFKPDTQLGQLPPILPQPPTLDHYTRILTSSFPHYILNSCIVASATTLVSVALGAAAGYALGQLPVRGKIPILVIFLAISMFPPISIVVPLYQFIQTAKLYNTYTGLIIPYITFSLPLAVWVLTAFFRDMPREVADAARVDGCGVLGTFWRIGIPLALPGIFTTAILTFIAAWNEFLFAFTFTNSIDHQTVTVGLTFLSSGYFIPWGDICAAAAIVTLPLIIVVLVFQRYIIRGITAGALVG
jgi:multiple sugar transport system permease protein